MVDQISDVVEFGIPGGQGDRGRDNTLKIGTVTTGVAGSAASASVSGTNPLQTLNLTIPRGDKGDPGLKGDPGSVNNHTHPATDIVSGKIALAQLPTGTTTSTVALGSHAHAVADVTGLEARLQAAEAPAHGLMRMRANQARPSIPHATMTLISTLSMAEDGISRGMGVSGTGILIPKDGIYQIRGSVSFSPNGTGYRICQITKNSTTDSNQLSYSPTLAASAVAPNTVETSNIARLVAGDILRLMCWQNSGAALSLSATPVGTAANTASQIYLEAIYLGPPVDKLP